MTQRTRHDRQAIATGDFWEAIGDRLGLHLVGWTMLESALFRQGSRTQRVEGSELAHALGRALDVPVPDLDQV